MGWGRGKSFKEYFQASKVYLGVLYGLVLGDDLAMGRASPMTRILICILAHGSIQLRHEDKLDFISRVSKA